MSTVVIGIVYDGGVILASDSKVTTRFKTDRIKLRLGVFNSRDLVLIGGAGTSAHIDQAVSFFRQEYRKRIDAMSLSSLVENALTRVAGRYRFPDADLLVAVRRDSKCDIFTVLYDTRTGRGTKQRSTSYAAIGDGEDVASYLLRRLWRRGLNRRQAERLALYVVREVWENVESCGGPTQIRIITNNSGTEPLAYFPRVTSRVLAPIIATLEPLGAKQQSVILGA